MTGSHFCKLAIILGVALALIAPSAASPLSIVERTAYGRRCSRSALRSTPLEMQLMYSFAQKRGDTTGVTVEEIQAMIRFRMKLIKEISTDRCITLKSRSFCCEMCVSGEKSLFCARKNFLKRFERGMKRELKRVSRIRRRSSSYNSYAPPSEDEYILDLFAVRCDKPMREQSCSEYVSCRLKPPHSRPLLSRISLTFLVLI